MRLYLFLIHAFTAALAFRYNYVDPRIYSFGFTGLAPGSFFDGEKLTGTHVELMKEVCCRASKRCAAALVPFDKCADGNHLSPVLDNRWHDVCIGVAATKRRKASYSTSDIEFFEVGRRALVTGVNSSVTLDDLLNPRNDIKLLIQGDPSRSKYNGLDLFLNEFFVKPENIISIFTDHPVKDIAKTLEILNDPCALGGAQKVGIVFLPLINPKDQFKLLKLLGGSIGPITPMVRNDEQGILDWWDYALKLFMCSPDYEKFCEKMDKMFGPNPVNCPDPSQVDCNNCTIPHRVPGCDCDSV